MNAVRLFVAALLLATFGVVGVARAERTILATCGGLSPVEVTCQATSIVPDDFADPFDVWVETSASEVFVGVVDVRIQTATGAREKLCRYYTNRARTCGENWDGRLEPGQIVTLTGNVTGFVEPLPASAVGTWSVSFIAHPFA
jgi:hypothetical protein